MSASYPLVYRKGVFLAPSDISSGFFNNATHSGHPATRAITSANPLESYMSIYFYINKYKYKYPSLCSLFPFVFSLFPLTYVFSLFSWTCQTHPLQSRRGALSRVSTCSGTS